MTEQWCQSAAPSLEYRARPPRPAAMSYRCKVCGTEWKQLKCDSTHDGNMFAAMWELHARPHEKTDEVIAESIAIQMGAF